LWESVSTLGKVDVEIETADLPLSKYPGGDFGQVKLKKRGVLIERATDVPHPYCFRF